MCIQEQYDEIELWYIKIKRVKKYYKNKDSLKIKKTIKCEKPLKRIKLNFMHYNL